jgi:hypothetical protein
VCPFAERHNQHGPLHKNDHVEKVEPKVVFQQVGIYKNAYCKRGEAQQEKPDYKKVFPGSYWKYVDANNDTTIAKTDSVYQKDHYTLTSGAYNSDTFYVPDYNQIPIWKYEAHTGPISNAGSYPFTSILSDSLPVGSSWTIYSWAGTQISRKIIAKDTTITISNVPYSPTIVIEEYYSYGPPAYIWIAKRYYTKNIGLIREDLYNAMDSTINTKELIDYIINR